MADVSSISLVAAPATAPVQRPRPRAHFDATNAQDLGCAALSGICGAALLFGTYAPFTGFLGYLLVAYVIFVLVYGTVTWLRADKIAVADMVFTVVSTSAVSLVLLALGAIIISTLWRGHEALTHANFFTQDMSKAGPLQGLDVGGVAHALIGTAWMIGMALVFSAPLGLITAIYLSETRTGFARIVRTVVEAMTALPTILAGLFIYAFWILQLGQQMSALAASLALSIMMLPYIVRSADLVLRLVPGNLREASAALGAPRWRTTRNVVLPTARSGLATSVILGIARGIGEASPVLLTAGFTTYMNTHPTEGPMVSLPILALKLVGSPNESYIKRGFACAAFLLVVVLVLFVTARLIAGRAAGEVSPRKAKRLAHASARDAERMERVAAQPRGVVAESQS